jgi:hypothetical protein
MQEIKKYARGEQSQYIRKQIIEGINCDNLVLRLAAKFERSVVWARSRMYTYERAYGDMGKNDPYLHKQ